MMIRYITLAIVKDEQTDVAATMTTANKNFLAAKMQYISQSDLDLLVHHNPIECVRMSATAEAKWIVIFHIKLLSGRTEEYCLLSQRGAPRTWADPRPLLRFLKNHYKLTAGRFDTSQLPGKFSQNPD